MKIYIIPSENKDIYIEYSCFSLLIIRFTYIMYTITSVIFYVVSCSLLYSYFYLNLWSIYVMCTFILTWTNKMKYYRPYNSVLKYTRVMVIVFNATFNNISVILWRSILLMEETGVPGENHWPVVSHWKTLLHNAISSTTRHERDSNSQR